MRRQPAVLASALLASAVLLYAIAVVLNEILRGAHPERDLPPLWLLLTLSAVLLPGAFVGAVVAARQPRNAVGWLFLAYPWGFGLAGACVSYRDLGLPGAEYADWINRLSAFPWFGGAVFGLLLFPSGRLPSPRWRWVAWTPLVSPALGMVPPEWFAAVRLSIDALSAIGWLVGLAVAIAALVVRFRGAHGVVRQQLKWVFYAAALIVAGLILLVVTFQLTHDPTAVSYVFFFILLALGLVPLAAGVAILRYRLYDIDVLINRTLVYAVVTATLSATFFGGLVVLQTLLRALTSGSELAVAASTLMSFGLFQPVRRSVQDGVDRRFNRSRYDAARTLDAFADRLRDEVDLDTLRTDLIGVVQQTMSPAHASLWLKVAPR